MQKKIIVSFPGETPLNLKKCSKKSNNFHPVPAASTAVLLLACYCGSTTMRRWNDNHVDPEQIDL